MYLIYLNYNLTSQFIKTMINQTVDVKLISNLYKGIENIYDNKKEINIYFETISIPTIELLKEYLYLFLPIRFEIYVEGETNYTLNYKTNLEQKVKLAINENQYISGKLLDIKSCNTSIIESKLTELNNKYLEEKFNLLGEIIKACGNFFIYDKIHLNLPKYKGIEFYDMSIEHKNNHLVIYYNFRFSTKYSKIEYYVILMIFIFTLFISGIYHQNKKGKKNKNKKKKDLLIEDGVELNNMD